VVYVMDSSSLGRIGLFLLAQGEVIPGIAFIAAGMVFAGWLVRYLRS
jgi:hypothetical protein